MSRDKNDPRKRYIEQRCQAKTREVEWLFTFDTWWQMWQDSGRWEQRGRKADQYCMARRGDVGPYSPDNVDIVVCKVNMSDACVGKASWNKGRTLSAEHVEKIRAIRTGTHRTEETKAKLSQHNKGRPWTEARRQAYLNSRLNKASV